jgi:hypothetical protein
MSLVEYSTLIRTIGPFFIAGTVAGLASAAVAPTFGPLFMLYTGVWTLAYLTVFLGAFIGLVSYELVTRARFD